MAEENKHPPTTEEQAPPEMPRKAPKMERAEIPDVGGGPAPSAKVIDLSAMRSTPEKDAPPDIPKETEAPSVSVTEYSKREWEKPMPEPEKPKPKRGRPAKSEKAAPTEPGARKEAQAEKPRRGRPSKAEKVAPEQTKPPKAGKTHAAPEEKAAPPAPEVPPTPRDATRAEKEEIVYLDLSDLHPFKDHPFGVRDDAEMKSLVESVRNGGVNQPALVRPREGGGYEIIAGHRRQMASQLAGYRNMPCIVRNMTDDEAILAMTDDNLRQRETILPSEKAMSLKMQYQQLAQCKAIYDKNAETILGNMDSVLFLGGRESSTIKEISENWLGKATISMQTEGRSRGQSESYSQNTQRLGRELMTPSELATMPGDRCILQLRGLPPFYSKKYDLKQHPNYKYTAEADKVKNAFDLNGLVTRRMDKLNPNETYTVYKVDVPDEALTDEDEDILNYDDLDDPDAFV